MTDSFTVYIDEAGDEGFVFHPNEQGSSRWLVLSAVVFHNSDDLLAVKLLREIREKLKKQPKQSLHFRKLRHEHRVPYVRAIGKVKVRTVSVLIHKPSIKEPERFQSESFLLYRYAVRLLLERISWLCRDHYQEGDGDGTAEIIFSDRSAMSYDDLRSYLKRLKEITEARDIRIDWRVIKPEKVKAVNHDQLAGLQIADAVATSIFFALNLNQYGETEDRYLHLLAPTMYHNKKTILGYGLKFWPEDLGTLAVSMPHLKIFENYK